VASPVKATQAVVEEARRSPQPPPKKEGARARRRRKAAQAAKKAAKTAVAAMEVVSFSSAEVKRKGASKSKSKSKAAAGNQETREAKAKRAASAPAAAESTSPKVECSGKGKGGSKAALQRTIYVSGALRAAEKAGYKSAGVLMYHISDDSRHRGRLAGVSLLVAMQVRTIHARRLIQTVRGVAKSQQRWALISALRSGCQGGLTPPNHIHGGVCQWCLSISTPMNVIWRCESPFFLTTVFRVQR